jgi:hypothetical protein
MLRISQMSVMLWILLAAAGIALSSFAIFQTGRSMGFPQTEQQSQNQQQPSGQQPATNQTVMQGDENKPSRWTQIKEYIKDKWNWIVETAERNDKAVVAISTAVIAAFTIVLAIATGFLFISSEKVAQAAVSAFNLAKRPELASQFRSWRIRRFGADQSPIITFEISNAGDSHAHILRATYDFEVASDIPASFRKHGSIRDMPALLGPRSESGSLVINDLPIITAEDHQSVESGNLFLFLRNWVIYRDVFGNVHEIGFTGRYGRIVDSDGKDALGFRFPDTALVPSQWWGRAILDLRRLNFLRSIPPEDRQKYE